MMTLYTSTALAHDQIAILYYSIVLTCVTVMVALIIGIIQLLNVVLNVAEPEGSFWHGVEVAGDHYDVIGKFDYVCVYRFISMPARYPLSRHRLRNHQCSLSPNHVMHCRTESETDLGGSICGLFLVFGGLSILLYKPWRRRIDRRRPQRAQDTSLGSGTVETDVRQSELDSRLTGPGEKNWVE